MKEITIYTDGACSKNPGPGGWGAILIYGEHEKEFSGYVSMTTNQRMEMSAVIGGMNQLKEACNVKVYSDSAYVINAFNQRWLENWQRNGWKNAKKNPVENQDLWKELLKLAQKHQITWIKVKGHSDNVYNNRCDELAKGEINKNR